MNEPLTAITGRVPLHLVRDQAVLDEHEQAMSWGGPRIPRRSLPTRPRLSPWRRLVLAITRLRASFH